MPVKQLETTCWVIAYPDGKLDARWDERHFSDRDLAADTIYDETDRDPADGDPAATELPGACFFIVCDGCGEQYGREEDMTDHFTSPSDAAWHSGDTEFRADGTTWCENCRSYDDDPGTAPVPAAPEGEE